MTTGRATGREGRSRRPPSSGRSVCSRASTSCTSLRFCNLRRPPSSPGSGRRSSSSGEIPRSTWRSSPAAPASCFPRSTPPSVLISAPRQGHTPVHVIGWERVEAVDADTDTDYDRHAYLPQGRRTAGPTHNPHRSLSNRASSTDNAVSVRPRAAAAARTERRVPRPY